MNNKRFERELRNMVNAGCNYIGINWINSGMRSPDEADRMTQLLIDNGYKEKAATYNQKSENGHYIRNPQEDWTK